MTCDEQNTWWSTLIWFLFSKWSKKYILNTLQWLLIYLPRILWYWHFSNCGSPNDFDLNNSGNNVIALPFLSTLISILVPLQGLTTSDKQMPSDIAKSTMDYFQCAFYHVFDYLDVLKGRLISESFSVWLKNPTKGAIPLPWALSM